MFKFTSVVIFVLLFINSANAEVKYFSNIEIGTQCNETKERRVVVTTQEDFEKIWVDTFGKDKPIPTHAQPPTPNTPPSKLDFDKGMVFIAFMGNDKKDSAIEVTEVVPKSGGLSIIVKLKHSKSDGKSRPYHFVWIHSKKDTNKIIVEDVEDK